jgi:hypothetical protein
MNTEMNPQPPLAPVQAAATPPPPNFTIPNSPFKIPPPPPPNFTIPNSLFKIQTRRPRSKIARLPHLVRQLLNHSLQEGLDNVEICVRLHTLGHKHIIPRNISTWARTGYREWLREQSQLQVSLAQTNAALAQLGRPGQPGAPDLPRLVDTFMATLLQQVFQDFDPASLKSLLAEKPAEFFRLLQSLNGHLSARAADKRAELDRARCQVEVSEKTQAVRNVPASVRTMWDLQRRIYEDPEKSDPVTFVLQHPFDPRPSETTSPTPATKPE